MAGTALLAVMVPLLPVSIGTAESAATERLLESALPIPQEEELKTGWEASVTVSGSITDGNTDVTRAGVGADAIHRTEKDRWTLGFQWNYAKENNNLTQRRTTGNAKYDYFIDDRSYAYASAGAMNDALASLDLRANVGGGYGYQFLDNDEWVVGGEIGLAWFKEDFKGGFGDDYIAARGAYDALWNYSEKVAFEQHFQVFPSLEDSNDVYFRMDTRARASLTEKMFGQAQWVWDYDNTPFPGNKRSDHLFLLGVGWSL